jgi:ABC-type transporter Mla maintaining outer membrane lipid asymmetry ATPase subunit MlaF
VTRASAPVVELTGITKQYGALRPLRIERLAVAEGEQVALVGLDQPAAEVFINLVTGATLPDSGEVRVFGRATAEITDSGDWLATLDRFGIVSDRSALLDALSVVQNLALPFSLEIEPPTSDIRSQATALAREVGLDERWWDTAAGRLDAPARLRARLARALALDPGVLLLEHPTATLPPDARPELARDLRRVAGRRGVAAISLTMDRTFAAAAGRTLTLEPTSGRLKRAWFRGL